MGFVEVVAFHCPRCGRAVRLREGARVIRCRSCGGRSLLPTRPPEPRFYVEPELDRRAAADAAKAFLRRPPNRRRLDRDAKILAPRLYYLPFHNATGRRVGVFRSKVPELRRRQQGWSERRSAPTTGGWRETRPPVQVVETEDTRVQIAELNVWAPAFRSTRWDLTAFDAGAARLRSSLRPLDLPRLQADGTVVSVSVPIEDTEARALRADSETRAVGVQRRTVFFPFWRVPYAVAGARYEVLVAAAGEPGSVVCGRAPAEIEGLGKLRLEAAAAGLALGAGARSVIPALMSGTMGSGLALGAAVTGAGLLLTLDARLRRRRVRPDTLVWMGDIHRRES